MIKAYFKSQLYHFTTICCKVYKINYKEKTKYFKIKPRILQKSLLKELFIKNCFVVNLHKLFLQKTYYIPKVGIIGILILTFIIFIYNNKVFAASCFKLKDIDYCKSVDIDNIKNKFELYCVEYNYDEINNNENESSEKCSVFFPLEVRDIGSAENIRLSGIDCSKKENMENAECDAFCSAFPDAEDCVNGCRNNNNNGYSDTIRHCITEKCKNNPDADGCLVCNAVSINGDNNGDYNPSSNGYATWPQIGIGKINVKGTCIDGYAYSSPNTPPTRDCNNIGDADNQVASWGMVRNECVKGCKIYMEENDGNKILDPILSKAGINWKMCNNSSCDTISNDNTLSVGHNNKIIAGSCNSGYAVKDEYDKDDINNNLKYPIAVCDNGTWKIEKNEENCVKTCSSELINPSVTSTSENYYNLVKNEGNYIISWPETKSGNIATIECASGYVTYDGIDITDKTVLASLSNGANLKTSITRKCNEDGTWEGSGLSSTLTTEEQKNKDINDFKNKLYTKGCFKPGYNVYNFTGSVQTFNVPKFVPMVEAEIWGAAGDSPAKTSAFGGKASTKIITIGKYNSSTSITSLNNLYIYVGGTPKDGIGGWNGGGNGQQAGGGATDIRISNSNSLTCNINTDPRILVVGGGGGSTNNGSSGNGAGGGLNGNYGAFSQTTSDKAGQGGTQYGGGKAAQYTCTNTTCSVRQDGTCGNGGSSSSESGGRGGGGGWYGGGSGCLCADGGGGSGYYDTNKGYLMDSSMSMQTSYYGEGFAILYYGMAKPTNADLLKP